MTRHDFSHVHKNGSTSHQEGSINMDEMYKQVANKAIKALQDIKAGQLNDKTISNTLRTGN